MALINCKECGSEVSTKARKCPKCGAPVPIKTNEAISAVFVLLIIAFVIYLIFFSGDKKTTENTAPNSSISAQNTTPNNLSSPIQADTGAQKPQTPPKDDAPQEFIVTKKTLACNQVSDFEKVSKAVDQIDMQWLANNMLCFLVSKGTLAYLIKGDGMFAYYCFGKRKSCIGGWATILDTEEVYPPPQTLSKGSLRVCRGDDAEDNYAPEYKIPVGLTLMDTGPLDQATVQAPLLNAIAVITKAGVIRSGDKCTVLPAKLVDHAEGEPPGKDVQRTLNASQNRVLEAYRLGNQPQLPIGFPTIDAFVMDDFK